MELNRPGAFWVWSLDVADVGTRKLHFLELGWHGRDIRNGIQQNFSHQAPRIVSRIESLFGFVARRDFAATLIGLRIQNRTHQGLQIEIVFDQIVSRCRKQLFIAGRIGDSHIINVFNQTDGKEPGPHAIGNRSGKVRIVGRSHPVCERSAAVACEIEINGVAIKWCRWLRLACDRLNQFTFSRQENRSNSISVSSVTTPAFGSHSGEKVCKCIVLIVGPFFQRMVVAFGTRNRQTQKRLARVLGHVFRILVQREKIGGAVFDAAAFRRQDFTNEVVPRRVGLDVFANPLVKRLHSFWPKSCAVDQ